MTEAQLMAEADQRAAAYLASVPTRRVFPDAEAISALDAFDAGFGEPPLSPDAALDLLDRIGSPATVASNGPNYFGFVIGASLPAAAAADRLALAWDQCASAFANSPAASRIEKAAARLVLEALDLPRESAVGFGTSATACAMTCFTAARRVLLARAGWDFDRDGLDGAPPLRVVVPEMVHITVLKALRVLGFGTGKLLRAPCDQHGRVLPEQLPSLDDRTILCLQAGEVNTGEFDPFAELLPRAVEAGAWVHIDGAFGLWARAGAEARPLAAGAEMADSWTVDGHKWLNTPYDGAMAICRDAGALAAAMDANAAYSRAEPDAQKNLTLEFSRRARGIAIWAALRTLGRAGVAEIVERHRRQARTLAEGLRGAGFHVLNRVVLNQVLVRCDTDEQTTALLVHVQGGGEAWFSGTLWQGRPAFRISFSSWRTTEADIAHLLRVILAARS